MKAIPSTKSPLIAVGFLVAALIIFFISQANESPRRPATVTDAGQGSSNGAPNSPQLPVDQLRGKWRGVAYQGEFGGFNSSRPLQRDAQGRIVRPANNDTTPTETLEFFVEIDDKYLAIQGVEACKITLTYREANGQTHESAGIFRILPPRAPRMREAKPNERAEAEMVQRPMRLPTWQVEDRQDLIVFDGSPGKMELVSIDDDSLELQGEIRSVGDVSLMRKVFIVLHRDGGPGSEAPAESAAADAPTSEEAPTETPEADAPQTVAPTEADESSDSNADSPKVGE